MSNEILIAIISAGAALVGSIIGAGATLLATWLARKVQESGKVSVFAKMVGSKSSDHSQIGFYRSQTKPGLYMRIPLWLDICNTSGVSRIVRNLNLCAYNQKKEVSELVPIQRIGDGDSAIVLGDNQAYTFVIPANSARRFDVEFMLHENELLEGAKQFDEIILSYFDEKNKIHAFHLCNIEKCWIQGSIEIQKQWIPLNKKCKYAK